MKQKNLALILFMMIIVVPLTTAQIIDSPSLDASLSYQDPDPVEPSNEVELRFSVKNTGKSPAKSAQFTVETDYPFSIAPGEDLIKSVGDIKLYDSGEIDTGEVTVKFKLIIDENALEGDYNLVLKYKTEGGISKGDWIEFNTFTISVGSSATYLILKESKITPELVGPGETGELSLTLANNGNSNLEDITITIDLDELTEISPLKTSNELIIQRLTAGNEESTTFSFIVAPDADVKIYKIPVKLSYSDERGIEYEKTTYTSIVINSEPEYVLNLEDSEVYKKKQNGDIVISLSNIGVSDINYATLTLKESEYYTILSADAVYLGNLESDDFETAQFTIYTNDYIEEVPLELTLFYKDNYNKNYEEDITLQMKLFTSSQAKRYGLSQGSSILAPVIILIIIGGGAWFWWKKYRKKKSKK